MSYWYGCREWSSAELLGCLVGGCQRRFLSSAGSLEWLPVKTANGSVGRAGAPGKGAFFHVFSQAQLARSCAAGLPSPFSCRSPAFWGESKRAHIASHAAWATASVESMCRLGRCLLTGLPHFPESPATESPRVPRPALPPTCAASRAAG